MKSLPLALALLLALAGPALAQPGSNGKPPDCGALLESWSGVAYAIDGDTLAGVGLKPHIRIWGIQAPELRDKQTGQESLAGLRARSALVDLLAGSDGKVWCRALKFDRYCRLVAMCNVATDPAPGSTSPTPLDLGTFMLLTGYAYGYYLEDTPPWDAAAGQRYTKLEVGARQRKVGLWPMWLGEK